MKISLLQAIGNFLFGRKYYANIILTRGIERYEISSFIFLSKEQAEQHRRSLDTNRSFQFVERVSFRSRENYPTTFVP